MKFTPKSDQEFEKEKTERKAKWAPWPAGTICDYEIVSSVEKPSKKGNSMIEIEVKVYNPAGESKQITDWLGDWNEYKLKRICEAGGILERYEAGQVDDYDLGGKTGKCKLALQKGSQKDDGTFYSDKNVIQEYLKVPSSRKSEYSSDIPLDLDDEIGF